MSGDWIERFDAVVRRWVNDGGALPERFARHRQWVAHRCRREAISTGDPLMMERSLQLSSRLWAGPPPVVRLAAMAYVATVCSVEYGVRGRQALDEGVDLCERVLRDADAAGAELTRGFAELATLRAQTMRHLVGMLLVRYHQSIEQRKYGPSDAFGRRLEQVSNQIDNLLGELLTIDSEHAETLTLYGWARTYDWQLWDDRAALDAALQALRAAYASPLPDDADHLGSITAGYVRTTAAMRLANALITSDRETEVREGADLLSQLNESLPPGSLPSVGNLVTEAAARVYLWNLAPTPEAEAQVLATHRAALLATLDVMPMSAWAVAGQWGGFLNVVGRPVAAAVPYAIATALLPHLVRRELTREQREELIHGAPGVGVRAALGLTLAGDARTAVRCLELSRGIMLNIALSEARGTGRIQP